MNTDPTEPYTVSRGDRIAQLVVQQVEAVEWVEVDELDTTVARHVRLRLHRRLRRRHGGTMTTRRPFRFGVQTSGPADADGLARACPTGRSARLLHALHARSLRGHGARADGRDLGRGRGHRHAAHRHARARQRLQASGGRRQGSGDARRAVRGPARVRHRRRLDDRRLHRARSPVRLPSHPDRAPR